MISVLLSIVFIFSFVGCTSQMAISNGGYTDISLVRESKEYKIRRLKEVKETAKVVFGIPVSNVQQRNGIIFRFNGINLNQVNSSLPVFTFIGMLVPVFAASYSNSINSNESAIGTLLLPTLVAVPIAGAINNLLWNNSAMKMASFNVNSRLIYENPSIDVFTNPKYEIENDNSLWTQTATVKAKVMGATIKTDDEDEDGNAEEKIISNIEIEKTSKVIPQTKDSTLVNKKVNTQPEITEKLVIINYPSNAKLYIDNVKMVGCPYQGILSCTKHSFYIANFDNSLRRTIEITKTGDQTISLEFE